MQNGDVESSIGTIGRELLNAYVFKSLTEVQEKAEEWIVDYNYNRPHEALSFKALADF
jgi:putative transposase